jgi:hypothetical protein
MNDASNESPSSEEGPRQIYAPRRIELVTFGGGAGGNAETDITVRLWTPDARLLQKLTLLAVSEGDAPGAVVLAGRGLLQWWYAVENDQVRGAGGSAVNDLLGTSAVPVAFPANAGLAGASRDIVTIADGVQVRLRVPAQAPGGTAGKIYAQARFQPANLGIIPWRQWDEIRSECKIDIVKGDVLRVP